MSCEVLFSEMAFVSVMVTLSLHGSRMICQDDVGEREKEESG